MGVLVLAALCLGAVGQAPLVVDRQAQAVIVLPDGAGEQVRTAAEDLRDVLRQMSGAELEIISEGKLRADEQRTVVYVGPCRALRKMGIFLEKLPREGWIIRVRGKTVVLAGRENETRPGDTEMGTQWAVSTFCEEVLGVRWLWPGELGTVIPKRRTIVVAEVERSGAPAIAQRKMRDALGRKSQKLQRAIDSAKPDWKKIAAMKKQSQAWFRHMKLGSTLNLQYGHAFTRWWERFSKTHPEYFAMHLDGSRIWPTVLGGYDRVKLCVSNPAVVEQVVRDAQEFFARYPYMDSISASPNDNAYNGHCMCSQCKALDAPEAKKVILYSVRDGKRVEFEYPALTDRYVHFYNAVAERLEKVAPGKLVGGYAYGAWRAPPVREKVRENVFIGFVGLTYINDGLLSEQRREWDGWARATSKIFLRPNLLHDARGMPVVFVHKLAQDLAHCYDTGMFATDFDSLLHHWAAQGLNYYVLAKLLWNPHADVEAIVRDYCEKGFGPAAEDVRAYFAALEKVTEELAADPKRDPRTREHMADLMPRHYTPEVLAALRRHLEEGQRKARAAGAEDVVKRIDFLLVGLRIGEVNAEALRAWQEYQRGGDAEAARRAIEAREKFYQELGTSFAANVVDLYYRKNRWTHWGRLPLKRVRR